MFAIACLMAVTAAASVQGSFQRTLTVGASATLDVRTRSGDISIKNGPAGSISITGKIHVENRWISGDRQAEVSTLEKNPPIQQNGNSIVIDYPTSHEIAIDYEIVVPSDTTVRSHSGSGDQQVEGLKTSLEMESGSGDMRIRDIGGSAKVHTGSGNVEVYDLAGGLDAQTGSGDVRLEQKGAGDVRVRTGSGDLELRGVNGSLSVETGSGDVRVDGRQTGAWELRTGSGEVEIRLPSDAKFDLDATTSSGEVESNRAVNMVVQGRIESSRKSIKGQVNGGGPLLRVHTGSGDVRLD
jgi:DUF4097 and DUF4098 domain-containing protein YvlB